MLQKYYAFAKATRPHISAATTISYLPTNVPLLMASTPLSTQLTNTQMMCDFHKLFSQIKLLSKQVITHTPLLQTL